MKAKLFFRLMVLGLLVMACSKSHDEFPVLEEPEASEPIEESVEMGSISLNPILKDAIQITTGKPPALEDLLDEMNVEIKKQEISGWLYLSNTNYSDLSATIPLTPGSYALLISNYTFSASRFANPAYGAQIQFTVTAGANTPLDLELALLDLATTINFSSELTLTYPDIEARVEYIQDGFGIGPFLNWTITDNGRTGYLNTYAGDFAFDDYFYATTGILNLEITATDNLGNPVVVTKTYLNATANQHYNITVEQTAAASASLNITLGDEGIIDDTVTFPF